MRKVLIFVFLVILLALPVRAMDFSAPEPPRSAEEYLPKEADSFAQGVWDVFSAAAKTFTPSLYDALQICLHLFAVMLMVSLVSQFAGHTCMELAGMAASAALLLAPSRSLIDLGIETVRELQDYGRLLLPVMALALAASGGVTASSALYVGTAIVDAILSSAITDLVLPLIWAFLALSIAHGAVGEPILAALRDLIRKLMESTLKLTLYIFTGYMTVTGVVAGTADAAAGKAARIAISGAVPVVGGILSDATDAVLLSASALGSGAGVWGILSVLAIFCAPALRIGLQYLLLKLTASLGGSLGSHRAAGLVGDFAAAMGILMALVSTQMTLLLISTVCFLRVMG